MSDQVITKTLTVSGMTCSSCEIKIENKLKKIVGVVSVEATYATEIVSVTFDASQVSIDNLIKAIERLDYQVITNPSPVKKTADHSALLAIGIILLALYIIIKNTVGFNFIPEIKPTMGYGLLFVIGLLTSLHCIAMCGGINLSQSVAYGAGEKNTFSKLKPSILYNAGRVTSYTIVGGIVGAIGSVVSLSGSAKGLVSIIAGVFMILMGFNMLHIFSHPLLRKLTPRLPKSLGKIIHSNKRNAGPFYIGLFNGLMPCGPLQSMQLYALGTGSFVAGALSMFLFSLGTVPLMFSFGAVSSFLSSNFTNNMMKVSAALVMLLGLIMLNRGLNLSGILF